MGGGVGRWRGRSRVSGSLTSSQISVDLQDLYSFVAASKGETAQPRFLFWASAKSLGFCLMLGLTV